MNLLAPSLTLLNQCKLDALPHGIDSFSTHADLIAKVPFELAGLCAAASARARRSTAAASARHRHDGMIAFAKAASCPSELLQRVYWKKSFYEDIE